MEATSYSKSCNGPNKLHGVTTQKKQIKYIYKHITSVEHFEAALFKNSKPSERSSSQKVNPHGGSDGKEFSRNFINRQDLLPCSQELVSGAYPDPEGSREEPHAPFTKNNIVLPSTRWSTTQYSTTLQAVRLKNRGSIPGRGNFYSRHSNPYQWVTGLKGQRCEADRLTPTTPKVVSEWSYTCTPPIHLHGVLRHKMKSSPPIYVSLKGVKQSRYKPRLAQMVPGS
jgi:hypothetical protein